MFKAWRVDLIGGNFLAVDVWPQGDGVPGQIIVFGADVRRVRRVAFGVADLIRMSVERLDNPSVLDDVFGELML